MSQNLTEIQNTVEQKEREEKRQKTLEACLVEDNTRLLIDLIELHATDKEYINQAVTVKGQQYTSLIHWAIATSKKEVLLALLRTEAIDIGKMNKAGQTPLVFSLSRNDIDCAKMLLKKDGILATIVKKDTFQKDAMTYAKAVGFNLDSFLTPELRIVFDPQSAHDWARARDTKEEQDRGEGFEDRLRKAMRVFSASEKYKKAASNYKLQDIQKELRNLAEKIFSKHLKDSDEKKRTAETEKLKAHLCAIENFFTRMPNVFLTEPDEGGGYRPVSDIACMNDYFLILWAACHDTESKTAELREQEMSDANIIEDRKRRLLQAIHDVYRAYDASRTSSCVEGTYNIVTDALAQSHPIATSTGNRLTLIFENTSVVALAGRVVKEGYYFYRKTLDNKTKAELDTFVSDSQAIIVPKDLEDVFLNAQGYIKKYIKEVIPEKLLGKLTPEPKSKNTKRQTLAELLSEGSTQEALSAINLEDVNPKTFEESETLRNLTPLPATLVHFATVINGYEKIDTKAFQEWLLSVDREILHRKISIHGKEKALFGHLLDNIENTSDRLVILEIFIENKCISGDYRDLEAAFSYALNMKDADRRWVFLDALMQSPVFSRSVIGRDLWDNMANNTPELFDTVLETMMQTQRKDWLDLRWSPKMSDLLLSDRLPKTKKIMCVNQDFYPAIFCKLLEHDAEKLIDFILPQQGGLRRAYVMMFYSSDTVVREKLLAKINAHLSKNNQTFSDMLINWKDIMGDMFKLGGWAGSDCIKRFINVILTDDKLNIGVDEIFQYIGTAMQNPDLLPSELNCVWATAHLLIAKGALKNSQVISDFVINALTVMDTCLASTWANAFMIWPGAMQKIQSCMQEKNWRPDAVALERIQLGVLRCLKTSKLEWVCIGGVAQIIEGDLMPICRSLIDKGYEFKPTGLMEMGVNLVSKLLADQRMRINIKTLTRKDTKVLLETAEKNAEKKCILELIEQRINRQRESNQTPSGNQKPILFSFRQMVDTKEEKEEKEMRKQQRNTPLKSEK